MSIELQLEEATSFVDSLEEKLSSISIKEWMETKGTLFEEIFKSYISICSDIDPSHMSRIQTFEMIHGKFALYKILRSQIKETRDYILTYTAIHKSISKIIILQELDNDTRKKADMIYSKLYEHYDEIFELYTYLKKHLLLIEELDKLFPPLIDICFF